MTATLLLMLPVSWLYKGIHSEGEHDQSLDETTLILPAVVAGIVMVVQHSLALAFSLAGIVAGVQFRRALSDTFDTLFIFVAIAVGIAAGIKALDIAFVLTLFFAFGIAFEVPIATIILVWMGLTTPDKLSEKRPFVIVGAFCIGMLLTPPDVISQTLLAIPMWILFEFGVFFSRGVAKDKAARAEQEEPEDSEAGEGEETTSAATPAAASGSVGAARATTVPDDEVIPAFPGDPDPEKGADGIDQGRYKVMSEEELDAELDEIEAEFDAMESEDSDTPEDATDPVEEKLRTVNRLRDEGDVAGARTLLYEVLSEGNEDQAMVARNILAQLDGE